MRLKKRLLMSETMACAGTRDAALPPFIIRLSGTSGPNAGLSSKLKPGPGPDTPWDGLIYAFPFR